jgi:hypothetical protein
LVWLNARCTYPNFATPIDTDSIATPDELSIDVRNTDVLNDDVAAPSNTKTLALTGLLMSYKTTSSFVNVSHCTSSSLAQ